MRVVVYTRVSTQGQDLSIQKDKLVEYVKVRGFELIRIFEDKSTGSNIDREGFKEMMKFLAAGNADALIVFKLDRLGRSIRDLINIIDELKRLKVGFVSFTDNIDTTTANGRLFFYLMAALSEFEKELIKERTDLGKQKAMANGIKFGRKKKKVDIDTVMRRVFDGVPKSRIAKDMGMSQRTLSRRIKEHQLENL